MTYEEIMKVIENEIHMEYLCAEKSKWLMKKSLNPICKIKSYFSAKKFMHHVFGMNLIKRKLERLSKES